MDQKNPQKEISRIFKILEKRYSFFGLGVNAFNRLGPESFLNHYEILALRYPLETALIEKDIKILALEKDMKRFHINLPRNSNTILKSSKVLKYLSKKKNPAFLVYKPFMAMEKTALKNNWLILANHHRFGKMLFENKIKFREILKSLDLPVPLSEKFIYPQEIITHFDILQKKYGLPLVIQHPTQGGGRGTFFIKNIKEAREIIPLLGESEILVSQFVKGPSPSITGCVTPWGIIYTKPQYQILDLPECFNSKNKPYGGRWCGHDWSFSNFEEKTLDQAYNITQEIGEHLKKQGYRGIFGLDFIQDEKTKNLYLTEANPRLLGSFPILPMIQDREEEASILAFHILSFLKLNKKESDIMRRIFLEALATMKKDKIGAQIIIHNRSGSWARNFKEIKPGVYKLKKGKIDFERPGYSLYHLKRKEEFLLSDGLPCQFSPFSPNRRIMRLITIDKILKNYHSLTDWGHEIAEKSYELLSLKPVRFFRIKRLLNPKFMAKG